jgi:DNA-binding beta-propeller fold protein YncE
MTSRFLDPMASARTFAARRAGMTDGRKLRRELQRLKRKVSPSFGGEDVPAEWTMIEEVDELPEADDDVIGRIFVKKNAEAEDVIEVGLTDADGEPILVGLNTLGDTNEIDLALATAFGTGVTVNDTNGIAVDASGNVWIVDSGNDQVHTYEPDGTLLASYGSFGSGDGQLNGPRGIALDASGNVYIADSGNDRVQKFTSSFVYVSQFGSTGGGAQQYNAAEAVAINTTTGRIYVADSTLDKVEVYTSAHAYVGMIGSFGSGPGEFASPHDVAVDPVADEVYVCDKNNNRIQVFDGTSLAFVREFGTSGNGDGQFNDPEGVDVDATNGRVYVADTGNDRVQILDGATGEYLAKFGTRGTASGELNLPTKVALSSDGIAYIAEQVNNADRVSSLAADNHNHTPAVTIRSNSTGIGGGGSTESVDVSCNVDEICTGGGVDYISNANANLGESYPITNGWRCQGRNNTGSAQTITCYAVCMTVPI